jgi:hypothetical protein
MPELHEPALALIRQVREAHAAGSGSLSLGGLVDMLPTKLAADNVDRLRQRDHLALTVEGGDSGTFRNEGPEIVTQQAGISTTVPERVSGTYTLTPDGFSLLFDADHSILGRFFLISVRLESISVDERTIRIDGTGSLGDLTIVHS